MLVTSFSINTFSDERWIIFSVACLNPLLSLYTICQRRHLVDQSCEATVTARVRIGWVGFRECGELLLGNRFSLKMKGKVFRCCVRSATMYGSDTWCSKENEKVILRRMERAIMGAMCGWKVVDRKTTEGQMDKMRLKETVNGLVTANGIR